MREKIDKDQMANSILLLKLVVFRCAVKHVVNTQPSLRDAGHDEHHSLKHTILS